MNEEQHIIKFKHNDRLYFKFLYEDLYIHRCNSSKNIDNVINIIIRYNNLNIYTSIFSNNRFDYIFNLSNILYKLHTKDYYCKYNHNCKELI